MAPRSPLTTRVFYGSRAQHGSYERHNTWIECRYEPERFHDSTCHKLLARSIPRTRLVDACIWKMAKWSISCQGRWLWNSDGWHIKEWRDRSTVSSWSLKAIGNQLFQVSTKIRSNERRRESRLSWSYYPATSWLHARYQRTLSNIAVTKLGGDIFFPRR